MTKEPYVPPTIRELTGEERERARRLFLLAELERAVRRRRAAGREIRTILGQLEALEAPAS
jgi:hypothetical protein